MKSDRISDQPVESETSKPSAALLSLSTNTTEPRIDSRLLAEGFGNKRRTVIALLDKYRDRFERFGKVLFKKAPLPGSRTGQSERYALLNEDQSYLLLTLSRNSETVLDLKTKLVKSFAEARRVADIRKAEYLPSFHRLSDAIHTAAAESPNAKHVHANVARLINKTVGIKAGQRALAPVPQLALMIVAQEMAATAMQSANDHHDGYLQVKQSMRALSECTNLKVKHG